MNGQKTRVVYWGERLVSKDVLQSWTTPRKELFLIRFDVALPISIDLYVLPVASDCSKPWETIELVAVATVPDESALPIGSFLKGTGDPIPPGGEVLELGYDVCDAYGTSGLMNCGFTEQDRDAMTGYWALALNAHHLFGAAEDADAFREMSDVRVREHAPFYVVQLLARRPAPAPQP